MKKIILITACGKKKEKHPTIAGLLYKSPRIRYLYKKAKELKIPFYILSAKYGLVNSENVIEPYDEIMNKEICNKLKSQVEEILKNYDVILFYKGGAREEYCNCIRQITKTLKKDLIIFGYKQMGDINKLEKLIKKFQANNDVML